MQTIDELARAVVAGQPNAWSAMQLEVLDRVRNIVRSHPTMRTRDLHASPDELAELQTATLERLFRDDFGTIRRYLATADATPSESRQSFESWLYGAVDFTIREHLRA